MVSPIPKIFDPLEARKAAQEAPTATPEPRAADIARVRKKPASKPARVAPEAPSGSDEAAIRADFRLFLILLWRHLLNCDPTPAMLDLAWYLQHGPRRSVILAFRGFSKSWVTGAYALWRLYCNPQEKILVVSGSLARAVASTNWCLNIIMTWPLLAHLQPLPHQRQSSKAFDVGPATPEQSPSFHALGIGGQVVGFRADCIVPDDVETQQNSITPDMRLKVSDAVKEFDSVLKPGGVIKFLGTPHDADSLYCKLPERGYTVRVYPALYPTKEQLDGYGEKLAPYVIHQMAKLGPSCVGTSIMPTRFTNDDLEQRRLSLGNSEFALQFMLDTSLSDRNKYPLRLSDLMVMALDHRRGPESVVWSNDPAKRVTDLQPLGFEGDYFHYAQVAQGTPYRPYNRIVGHVDTSGRGADEIALSILAELNGIIFLLHLFATTAGYELPTLEAIADACVRYRVQVLRVESNFGDGMFVALLRPVLERAWKKHNDNARRAIKISSGPPADTDGGTMIEEVRVSNQLAKEKRILAAMEPVTQQHRLVVDRGVVEWDYSSMQAKESDARHWYSLFYQYAHLTKDRDCLNHDDRLDSLGGGVMAFADILGVDPAIMAKTSSDERFDEEWERLFGDGLVEDENGVFRQPVDAKRGSRMEALKPTKR